MVDRDAARWRPSEGDRVISEGGNNRLGQAQAPVPVSRDWMIDTSACHADDVSRNTVLAPRGADLAGLRDSHCDAVARHTQTSKARLATLPPSVQAGYPVSA